ncbi:MAG: hypothetical protein U0931_26675 [Vulcanimicrobiota bacterium]
MELFNITSTTMSAGAALPGLNPILGNAALDRLQTEISLAQSQALLDNFTQVTINQNMQKLMNIFASLMKNDSASKAAEPITSSGASAGGGTTGGSSTSNIAQADVKKTAKATGTGYYPDSSAMEGGYVDRKGKKLNTLQDFLAGKADYVSVAMDKNENIPYGTKLRIPELEKKYGRPIEFRVVDTGGAFTGKGSSRIDICTANEKASTDPTINGPLTLQFV